jgi:hypothetical protein
MKAYILLDGKRDHKEPWDFVDCVIKVLRLDPEGKRLKVEVVEE